MEASDANTEEKSEINLGFRHQIIFLLPKYKWDIWSWVMKQPLETLGKDIYIYIYILFRVRTHYKKYTEEKKHQNYSLLR